MLQDLFVHVCILVTFIFIGGVIFKNTSENTAKQNRLILGLLTGVLGTLLMAFSIQVDVETIIDLRHLAIIIAAFFGGLTSSVICAIIIALSRLIFSPLSSMMLLVAFTSISIGIILGLISKLKITYKSKWSIMILVSTLLYTGLLMIRIHDVNNYLQIVIYYWSLSIFGNLFTYVLVMYISHSNFLFNEYKKQATFDFLTGLKNVRQFDHDMTNLKLSNKAKGQFALMLLDIDYFKKINDTYGHQAGDFILKQFANILRGAFPEQEKVFRIGGEEFSILLLNTKCSTAVLVGEEIRKKVENHKFILPDLKEIHISISIGVTINHVADESKEDIIRRADIALYEAKKSGRNRVCCNC
ncbi:GGDEF domain-containing protein [Metabacillus malikii]|uniref:Diguanylate cyclase n=1 Tax=Metabacillus malikii TaxID=1504265 RepID=A0ABT9ZJU8_9BACI|nr:GGDEF domain-containing protein [Metabacillus malikii]MDQ0232570.1 diguanylate cyclase [Metabacillus malikii]